MVEINFEGFQSFLVIFIVFGDFFPPFQKYLLPRPFLNCSGIILTVTQLKMVIPFLC